jgi:hypothetical protein
MRTLPSSPWIVRCSVQLYRWLLCLGPYIYRRQYGDLTLQLFRACCQDAYRQRGALGVLGLWLPLFSDVVAQMLAEHLSGLQRASELDVSVETASPSPLERIPSMSSVWQQINHQWIIPPLSALTRFRRRLTRPLMTLRSKAERELWLKHPANMDFEQHLHHWITMGPRTTHESGVVASGLQGKPSAFLRSTKASAQVVATLRQTIKAGDYRGKQLHFSGDVKVEHVEQQAGLYIRTNKQGERLRPENVVQGTHDWIRYEATIPVPEDALFIRFGLVLYGTGQIWLANAQLEVIEQS